MKKCGPSCCISSGIYCRNAVAQLGYARSKRAVWDIYPKKRWYRYSTSKDIQHIIEQHVEQGKHFALHLPDRAVQDAE